MKILIIEDDLSFQEILRRTLEQERYIVEVAPDYRTGLFKLSDYTYDCILLDINLPDGNGLNLLRELKEMKKTGSLIIISARDSIEDKVEGPRGRRLSGQTIPLGRTPLTYQECDAPQQSWWRAIRQLWQREGQPSYV